MDNPLQRGFLNINEAFGANLRSNVPVPKEIYPTLPVELRSVQSVTCSWHHSFRRFYLSPYPVPENHEASIFNL